MSTNTPVRFQGVVALLDDRSLIDELDGKIKECVESVEDAMADKSSATATLTLKLTFQRKKEYPQITVKPDVTLKKPNRPRASTNFFATPNNEPTRRDPNQHDIEDHIREVPAGGSVSKIA